MVKGGIVVVISGHGSNLQALIDASVRGEITAPIRAVISNKADAFGLERARLANIPALSLNVKDYADRAQFDQALADCIAEFEPSLVVLAGYMRILSAEFVQRFSGKMLNIHPSLLPKYPGLNTHQRAIEQGDSHAGTSVHFVTEELDGGPVLMQLMVAIEDGETEARLKAKVQKLEHALYPTVVQWCLEGRFTLQGNHAYLDGQRLEAPLIPLYDSHLA
nr:phosphoribosylglycinamide formyltransferase [Vibrio stylophorae]